MKGASIVGFSIDVSIVMFIVGSGSSKLCNSLRCFDLVHMVVAVSVSDCHSPWQSGKPWCYIVYFYHETLQQGVL